LREDEGLSTKLAFLQSKDGRMLLDQWLPFIIPCSGERDGMLAQLPTPEYFSRPRRNHATGDHDFSHFYAFLIGLAPSP
ncbi:MAG TPA: hypothetical protein VGJ16_08015, partial [Pirellulales bacterium]